MAHPIASTLARRFAIVAASLALSAGAGCSSTNANPEASVASANEDLYGLGAIASKWPGGVVPVCFVDLTAQKALQAQLPSLLANSWSAAANITFTGFGGCSGSGNQVSVAFASTTQSCSKSADCGFYDGCTNGLCTGYRGLTSTLGYGKPTVTLISDDSSTNQARFKYEVIHEFGHALGFVHEMERPDNWDGGVALRCPPPTVGDVQYLPINGGLYLTSTYDTSSIMNYCDPSGADTDLLSAGDIAGVSATAAYGPSIAPHCAVASSCSSQYVPASNGTPAHYQTLETATTSGCTSGVSSVQQFVNGAWVTLPALVANEQYPTVTTPSVGVLGSQVAGVATSGAPIGSSATVRACETSGSVTNCDAPTSVTVINCCTPITSCGGMCGSVSDGCGGTLDCGGCATGLHCTNNTCMKCSEVTTCGSGYSFNETTCACVRDTCACGGIYPKCTVCQ